MSSVAAIATIRTEGILSSLLPMKTVVSEQVGVTSGPKIIPEFKNEMKKCHKMATHLSSSLLLVKTNLVCGV